jgi:4-hydroxy 2-oxovalerate aldolase
MKNSKQNLVVLDCTLRDGGYYNNWEYTPELANKYLLALKEARVNVCEIGFRSLANSKYMGAFYYSSEEFLASLTIPKTIQIAVMINAKEFIGNKDAEKIDLVFPKSKAVSIVRIACVHSEVEKCDRIVHTLNSKGYAVIVNLMQANSLTVSQLSVACEKIRSWNCVQTLYLADSFGDMSPMQVAEKIGLLKSLWPNFLGMHAHDNKGLALANTLAAFDAGATYLDSTILGMGRGAGNTRTEELLLELNSRNIGNYVPEELFDLVQGDFRELQQQFNWGKNLEYYIAAQFGIHPTYVQEMLSKGKIQGKTFVSALKAIQSSGKGNSYSEENLIFALGQKNFTSAGSIQNGTKVNENSLQNLRDTLQTKGKKALILGNSNSLLSNEHHIMQYVKYNQPVVLSSSAKSALASQISQIFFASHYSKIFSELSLFQTSKNSIVLPMNILPESLCESLRDANFVNFPLVSAKDELNIEAGHCNVPSLDSLAYGLCIAMSLGCNEIVLAGFDGYEPNSEKQHSMLNVFELFRKSFPTIKLTSITPNTYSVRHISPYEPRNIHV